MESYVTSFHFLESLW